MALRTRVILATDADFDSSFLMFFSQVLAPYDGEAVAQSDRPQAGQKTVVQQRLRVPPSARVFSSRTAPLCSRQKDEGPGRLIGVEPPGPRCSAPW